MPEAMEEDPLDEYRIRFAQPGDDEEWGWLIRLMENWQVVAQPLTHQEQNDLIWQIIGAGGLGLGFALGVNLGPDVETKQAILQAARNVTLAIPHLFGPEEPMENGYFMWWDVLAEPISQPDVAATCLEVLEELSRHSDFRIQAAALHGLGHLEHPERAAAVDRYRERHPELANNSWVLQCRDGTVM